VSAGKSGKDSEWLEERILEIKEFCIAAMIMDMTRNLSIDDK
jgi:hypothetical protein